MSGRVAEAERLAREAHELGQRAQARDADTIYAAQLLTLRRREDRLAEYVSTVETFVERHPALVAWRAVLPLAHLLNGEREEGAGVVRGAGRGRLRGDPARHVLVHRDLRAGARRARTWATRVRARQLYAHAAAVPRPHGAGHPGGVLRVRRALPRAAGRDLRRRRRGRPSTSRPRWRSTPSAACCPLIPFIRVEYAQRAARPQPGPRRRARARAARSRALPRSGGRRDRDARRPR